MAANSGKVVGCCSARLAVDSRHYPPRLSFVLTQQLLLRVKTPDSGGSTRPGTSLCTVPTSSFRRATGDHSSALLISGNKGAMTTAVALREGPSCGRNGGRGGTGFLRLACSLLCPCPWFHAHNSVVLDFAGVAAVVAVWLRVGFWWCRPTGPTRCW